MSKITTIPLFLCITYLLIACGNAPVALPQGDEPTPNPINKAEEPTPEPLDSVTSTPDVEMHGGTILVNNIPFTFSTPQEIPSTRELSGLEIVSWLPNSSSKVLLRGNYDVGILDLDTQTTTIYASGEAPMATNEQPIWLPESEAIAYIFHDVKAKQYDLYISKEY